MLNIAILGTGAIADSHIQAYLKFKDQCQIVALADLFPDKAAAKAAQYGLKAAIFKDYRELIQKTDLHAASVCLPPFEHSLAGMALLRAGKHVLTEKPMATSLEECDAMIAAAAAGNCRLAVVAQNRYRTPIMKMKQVLASGLLGKVLHAQVDSFWWRGNNYYDLWWRGTWAKEGGGCTLNHAVHYIDIFQWMMGLPNEVQAVTLNLAHENSEVEDFSTAVLRYANGSVGQITASLVHHGEEQALVFQGERAKVALPWVVKAMRQKENGFPEDNPGVAAEIQAFYDQLPAVTLEGHDGQTANFLGAIAGREELLVDGVQGRRTLELITAIFQSGHLGEKVKLPLPTSAPFYTQQGILKHARHFHEKAKNVDNFANNEITFARDLGK